MTDFFLTNRHKLYCLTNKFNLEGIENCYRSYFVEYVYQKAILWYNQNICETLKCVVYCNQGL